MNYVHYTVNYFFTTGGTHTEAFNSEAEARACVDRLAAPCHWAIRKVDGLAHSYCIDLGRKSDFEARQRQAEIESNRRYWARVDAGCTCHALEDDFPTCPVCHE
jgi:hypothetical protein